MGQGFGDPNGTFTPRENSFSWSDLSFPDSDESISSISLAITRDPSVDWWEKLADGGIDNVDEEIRLEISNKVMLTYMQNTLFGSVRKRVGPSGTIISSLQIGTLELHTNKNRPIPIQIWPEGFYLGDRDRNPADKFHSWPLARLISDHLRLQGQTLHKNNFAILSGRIFDRAETYPRNALPKNQGE